MNKRITFLFFVLLASIYSWQGMAQEVTIGTGTSTQMQPLANYYGYERTADLYLASEIGADGAISNIAWNVNAIGSTHPIKIFLATTSATTFSESTYDDLVSSISPTLVYDGSIAETSNAGWVSFDLGTPFPYNGTDNLIVIVENNIGGNGNDGFNATKVTYTSENTDMHIYWREDNDLPTDTETPDGNRSNVRLEIMTLTPCTEAIAGTVVGDTAMEVCALSPFSLSVTGNSEPADGLTRSWQSSPAGAGTWTDLGVASATINITGIDVATDYRYHVECVNGGTDDSETIAVSLNPNPAECYCIPEGINTNRYIDNFSTSGGIQNISNLASGYSAGGYGDFTAMTLEANPGDEVNFTADVLGGSAGFRIWVDWNKDGAFDETEEVAYASTGYEGQHVGAFTVPATAISGDTRMRIVSHWLSMTGNINPCETGFNYGEFEDYTLTVAGGGTGTFPSPYCNIDEDGGDVIVEEITKVDFAGITITNDNDTDVLIDKTSVIVSVTASETYNLSVEGNTYGNFDTNIVAFIDWNQNDILDDAGEVFLIGTLTNSTGDDGIFVNMDIPVPADAVLGETRIRITKTYTDPVSVAIVTPCGIQFDPAGMGVESGYGQALDFTLNIEEGSASGEDCDQGDDSNAFENGYNITGGGDYRNADDFMVSADNTLNVQSIELNLISMTPITTLDLNFYNDDSGAPGATLVESVTGLVPYAQVQIGTAFGFNVYAVLVEVDLNFVGGTTGTTYWMEPVAQGGTTYWEVSTLGTLGAPIHTSEAGGAWVADIDGGQGVFKLHCNVADAPPTECLFSVSTVEPMTRLVMANVDNSSSPTSTVVLEDFTAIVVNAEPGATVAVAVEGNTVGPYTNYFTIFINTGGVEDAWSTYEMFEIGSITESTGTDGQQATSTITLPASLVEGEYLMRVVKNYDVSPTSPCGTYSFGQGEDYTLVIGELEDCAGTPDGGIASVNPEEGTPNSSYIVSSTGYSFGNGLTYQWQSNTDGSGWVNEGTADAAYSSYTATAPAVSGVVVEWRLEVTCTLSTETSYSEIATFTTIEASIYCIPVLDCSDGDNIVNVAFMEIDNTTDCSADGYGDYTAMSATVQSGGTYPISVTVGAGWNVESVSVWIDFDNSGSFDEVEFFYIGTGSGNTLTENIAIPTSAVDGDYRMRVRVAAVPVDSATWDMACDESQGYGETEDYTVTVDGTVGTEDFANVNFSYHPNPMSEVLYITANQKIESVVAFNVLGQQVVNNNQFADGKVDVSSLPTGTFIFRITFEGGVEENFKVLKK